MQHLAVGRLGYNYLNAGSAADANNNINNNNNASAPPIAAGGASAPSLEDVEVVASSATDAVEQAPPKEEQPYQYASALKMIHDMGFEDEEAAKIALDMHGGQVQQAVMALLSQP